MRAAHSASTFVRAIVATALSLLMAAQANGCGDGDAFSCFYDGESRAAGATFPSTDGCNTCTCTTDGIQCTTMGCLDTCTYDGQTYPVGQAFAALDGCNTCTCTAGGQVSCTEIACVTGCDYNGTRHDVGDSFPDADGCNTCTCEANGNVSCTLIACVDDCTHDGTTYPVGQTRPAGDGCNTCTCSESGGASDWVCTTIPCEDKTCTYDRQTFDIGDTFPDRDGCNTCTCEETVDGTTVSCTELACPTGCEYAGETWEIGASFRADDGCNDCSCLETGEVLCTKRACICNPENEWWRNYVALDAESCASIRYVCELPLIQFQNNCGCGCQQPLSCEQNIDCDPRECDGDTTTARCPYSNVDTSTRCTEELPCAQNFDQCRSPGASFGCGRCFNPSPDAICVGDRDCGRGEICEPARCACNGESICVPGCLDDSACGEGEMCGVSGRCLRMQCTSETMCPDNFTCIEGDECQRSPCTGSADCDGWCVNGSCYATRGTCSAAIP